MKKIFSVILLAILMTGCSSDDEEVLDCSLFDPEFPSLYIKLVDATGTNLLENGTIDPEDITVEGNFTGASFRYVPADEIAGPDADIRAIDHSLNLYIPYQSVFQYTIHLEGREPISVDFTAQLTQIPCNITYYMPVGAFYKTEALELNEKPDLYFVAEIEL